MKLEIMRANPATNITILTLNPLENKREQAQGIQAARKAKNVV
jgi:hypothetical protein